MNWIFLALRSEEQGWEKAIGLIVFAVIWLIAMIFSRINKAMQQSKAASQRPRIPTLQEAPPVTGDASRAGYDIQLQQRRDAAQQHRELIRQQLQQASRAATSARTAARVKGGQRPRQVPRMQQPRPVQQLVRPAVVPPPLPQKRAPVAPAPARMTLPAIAEAKGSTSAIAATEIRSGATAAAPAKRIPSANAALISRWLNPTTLRSQFILTELFQPPLSMREDRFNV